MALDNYDNLQTTIMGWIARPGDPKVLPAVPDMIRLFEAEASRRLKVGEAETYATIPLTAGQNAALLPTGCGVPRTVRFTETGSADSQLLAYLPPTQSGKVWSTTGSPKFYSIFFGAIAIAPIPAAAGSVVLDYLYDLPPLTPTAQSNWLLARHADVYLFGSLAEAELYIGHDERAPMWLQRREAAFASIIQEDLKRRWPGPLQILVDGITAPGGSGGGAGGAGGGLPPAQEADMGAVAVAYPASETAVYMDGYPGVRSLYIATAPSVLTIVLPRDDTMQPGEEIEVNFSAPVADFKFVEIPAGTTAGVVVPGTPTTAYGPGAAIIMRWVGADGIGWLLWK